MFSRQEKTRKLWHYFYHGFNPGVIARMLGMTYREVHDTLLKG